MDETLTACMRSTLIPFILGAVLCAPLSASARCAGAVAFGTLHDAYLATLTGSAETQNRSARTVLVTIGGTSVERIAKGLQRAGVEVDLPRLGNALRDAETLATRTLEGQRSDQDDTFHHSQNVTWLAKLFLSTGCAYSPKTASAVPSYATPPSTAKPDVSYGSRSTTISWIWPVGLGAIVTVLTGYKASRSMMMRRRQMERMPRFPISLPLNVTFTDTEGEMQQTDVEALDISQGGFKLKWDDAPPPGILVTLDLLGRQRMATVAWSNAYFAGIIFETALNKTELRALKDKDTS